MGFRHLMLSNASCLHVKNRQLIIKTDKEISIPIEDISSILIENRQMTVTVAALSQLAEEGVVVFFCDEKHLPCAILHPFAKHSRSFGMIKLQEALSLPSKKKLWQQIVKAKIENQSRCLALLGKTAQAEVLHAKSKEVTSGDTKNVEAQAARYYFTHVFSSWICRNNDEDPINSFLNYGYAILRGHIARLIVNYGFLPMKGLHHINETNAYNLADDFIEPFRPVVDLFVANRNPTEEMLPEDKRALYNLLTMDIDMDGEKYTVSYAAEKMIQSFHRCCMGKGEKLLLPTLIELVQHSYE